MVATTSDRGQTWTPSFDPNGDDQAAGWHLYLAMTYDGGTSWTSTDHTPADPVQRGCILVGHGIAPGGEAGPDWGSDKRNLPFDALEQQDADLVHAARGGALPATGASPALAVGGLLVLGALALSRRRPVS